MFREFATGLTKYLTRKSLAIIHVCLWWLCVIVFAATFVPSAAFFASFNFHGWLLGCMTYNEAQSCRHWEGLP